MKYLYKKLKGETMPKAGMKFLEEAGAFTYPAQWLDAYYTGDPETTKDWVIIMDNGGFYKVGAKFITWHRGQKSNKIIAACSWTHLSLYNLIKDLRNSISFSRDPNYQT